MLTATTPGTAAAPVFAGTLEMEPSPRVTAGAGSAAETITITALDATHFSVVGLGFRSFGHGHGRNSFHVRPARFYHCGGSHAFVAGDTFTVATTAGTLGNVTAIPINGFADGATEHDLQLERAERHHPVLTQVAGPSSTSATQQDGSASGSLVNFTIGTDGTVTGSFSNGKTAALGQLALASFANQQGLQLARQHRLRTDPGFGASRDRGRRHGRERQLIGRLAGTLERGHCHRVRQPDRGATRF